MGAILNSYFILSCLINQRGDVISLHYVSIPFLLFAFSTLKFLKTCLQQLTMPYKSYSKIM